LSLDSGQVSRDFDGIGVHGSPLVERQRGII
jgi:hypothetical protein